MTLRNGAIILLAVCGCGASTDQLAKKGGNTSPDASTGSTTVDGGGGGGSITCTDPGTPVTGPAIVPGTLNHMTLTGYAIDEACAPVANATIQLQYLTSTAYGASFSYVNPVTDATGAYTVKFDAVPDAINGGLAFSSTWFPSTYESDFRYVTVATQQATYNFHFRHRQIVTVGATTTVKLSPADPVCSNNAQDYHPWQLDQEWTCHTLRVQAPSAGTLTVQMVETDTPSSSTQLEVETADGNTLRYFSKTTSLPVSAGQWVLINPELIWGGTAQSFNITTAM